MLIPFKEAEHGFNSSLADGCHCGLNRLEGMERVMDDCWSCFAIVELQFKAPPSAA